jgi:hypothetical protein
VTICGGVRLTVELGPATEAICFPDLPLELAGAGMAGEPSTA